MKTLESKIIISAVLLLLNVLSGLLLTHRGRPYQNLPFNIHKLIALLTSVYLIVIFYKGLRGSSLNSQVVLYLITGILLILLLFVTGGLLSVAKVHPEWV